MRLCFDIETDGIEASRVHCIVTKDLDCGFIRRFHTRQHPGDCTAGDVEEAIKHLGEADELVGHNIIGYDIPTLQRLYPGWSPRGQIRDTQVIASLYLPRPVLAYKDAAVNGKNPGFPTKLYGNHSLEAWGHRIGVLKGDYKETTKDWSKFTPELMAYCQQDVEVSAALYAFLCSKGMSERSVELEHAFARRMDEISDTGFCFDYAGGERLQQVLVRRRAELDVAIRKTIPGWNLEYFTLKKKIKKTKHIEFNPGSRAHIARHLMERRGWKPAKWGKDGRPTLTDKILGPMPWEETQLLAEYFVVDGKLGFLVEGKSSLFSHYNKDDRRIHGRFIHQGTATSRCAHSSPNLSGVPKVGKPYGAEFRSLFGAPDGSVLVGVDASGLETRMLASRMAEFDGGAYAKVVLEADVHEENRKAAGLATRDQAKTFWYAFLYGAKDPKLGQIIGGSKAAGAKLRASFLATLPALKKVTDKAIAGGYVGLDGRVCHAPIQERLALNYRLQEDGAVAMKQAVVLFCDEAERRWGDQVKLCMFAHDELQIEVSDKEIAEDVGVLAAWSIAEAGRRFGLSVALDGDWKVGRTWFDTH